MPAVGTSLREDFSLKLRIYLRRKSQLHPDDTRDWETMTVMNMMMGDMTIMGMRMMTSILIVLMRMKTCMVITVMRDFCLGKERVNSLVSPDITGITCVLAYCCSYDVCVYVCRDAWNRVCVCRMLHTFYLQTKQILGVWNFSVP